MAKKLYEESSIQAIATAIRGKNGSSDTYTVAEMSAAIADIPTGGSVDSVLDGSVVELSTNATSLRDYAFRDCTSLRAIDAPNVATIGQYCFSGCSALEDIEFPSLTSNVGYGAFQNCSNLKTAIFEKYVAFGASCFSNCSKLNLVVLKANTLCNISNTTFSGTAFSSSGAGGTVYVPNALISQYQSASNWSTILGYANNQILPIEGSIYE